MPKTNETFIAEIGKKCNKNLKLGFYELRLVVKCLNNAGVKFPEKTLKIFGFGNEEDYE